MANLKIKILKGVRQNKVTYAMLWRYKAAKEKINKAVEKRNTKKAYKIMPAMEKRNLIGDMHYFEHLRPFLDVMPVSNGQRYYKPYDIDIGIVCDEFLYDSYKAAARMHPITPQNYKEVIKKCNMVLIVSAWRGLNNEWVELGNVGSPVRKTLLDVIDYAKSLNLPVIFYSKEDPPNYDVFLEFAKKCDSVFTSCAEVIEKYKRDCGHNRVQSLSFSINPVYHNPIGLYKFPKDNAVIFSGTWMSKYPDRLVDMEHIFDGVVEAGFRFKILDRCYSRNNVKYLYPQKYWKWVSPEVSHEYLQKIHKLYNWAININTIQNSKTMFANRVYELQANGNLLISNPSVGVSELFDGVFIVEKKEEVVKILKSLSAEEIAQRQMAGVRRVMTGETCFDRVGEILAVAGIKTAQPVRNIAVVCKNIGCAESFIKAQSYKSGKVAAFTAEQLDDGVLKQYDMVAFISESQKYDKYYLEDMSNGFKYTNSDYITKDAQHPHDYVDIFKDKCNTLFWSSSFTAAQLKEFNLTEPLANGYSVK